MTLTNGSRFLLVCISILFALTLVACGSPSPSSKNTNTGSGTSGGTGNGSGTSGGTFTGTGAPVDYAVPAVAIGNPVTDFTVKSLDTADQTDVPVTFGQVFAKGELPAGSQFMAKLTDGSQAILPTQVDVKATNADGSIRHAIITTRLPKLTAASSKTVNLVVVDSNSTAGTNVTLANLLASGFDATVSLTTGGTTYTSSAKNLLSASGANPKTWLAGPLVTEWLIAGPLTDSTGAEHPHLYVRYNIRAYTNLDAVRVDVVVENDWAYVPAPQNITYDASVNVCGNNVYSATGLTHYAQARWRKTFWCGTQPQIHIGENVAHLLSTGAIPNYDRSVTIPEADLADMKSSWTGPAIEPMGLGTVTSNMPMTGGRPDIGPVPRWVARYLISQDERAETVTLGNGDLAGTWNIHYRDKTTDLPVTLDDHPYMSIKSNNTYDSTRGVDDAFPTCGGDCSTPYTADSAHQPSLDYVPYMVTGDYYYLEELLFWANYNILQSNPKYRDFTKGLVQWEQVRGQAWTLRTLAHAAYIAPDNNPMKQYFIDKVAANLDYYNTKYTNNASAPKLGYITNGGAIKNEGGIGKLSPWNDDALTMVVDWLAHMGFTEAQAFRNWKVKFIYGRFANDPVFCKTDSATYRYVVQETYGTSPLIDDWASLLAATFPSDVGNCPTDFNGNPHDPESYLAITRGALAAAVAAGHTDANTFFDEVVAAQKAAGAAINNKPQWAIAPR